MLMYEYQAQVSKVIDGDTVDLIVDLGFKLYTNQRIRLSFIDAPEVSTVKGRISRDFLISVLPKGSNVVLISRKGDKYGRWLGEIKISNIMDKRLTDTNTTTINEAMIALGFASKYI
jgi:micrococcal nuclease